MSASGLFLLLALTVGTITFVVWPLINSRPEPDSASVAPDNRLHELRAERDALLTTIRDLDFDFQTGKLTEDDYQRQRAALLTQGAAILRQIDALESDVIESAVAARRESVSAQSTVDDRIEALVAAQRKQKPH